MEILRTLNTLQAGDGKETMLDNWLRDAQAEGLVFDCEFPVTVGTGGTPTATDLVNIITYYLNVVNLSYGPNNEFRPLEGANGVDLRHWHRGVNLKEVANDFVGVVQTTGAKLFHARLTYAARHPGMSGRSNAGRIGWTQGRSMYVKVQEGNALTAGTLNLTRTAAVPAKIAIKPIYRKGDTGRTPWTPLPSFRRIVFAGLDILGPDGLPVLVYDENAAYAATAIGKYSVKVGDLELVRQVTPQTMADEWARRFDAGGSDIQDTVTLLYAADQFGDADELPRGRPYVKLVTQDVAQLKLGFWFIPTIGEQERDAASTLTAGKTNGAVLGYHDDLPANAVRGAQATMPIEFVGPSDGRFLTREGVVATKDGDVALSIPSAKLNAVGAAVAAQPGGAKEQAARLAQKLTQLRVPGATGTDGVGQGGVTGRAGIRAAFSKLFG